MAETPLWRLGNPGEHRGSRTRSGVRGGNLIGKAVFAQIEFATDSPLEGDGFEPSVPRSPVSSVRAARRSCLRGSGSGSARFLLVSLPFHGADRPCGLGGLRFIALGGFCVPAAV